ncbi:MAG TPA: DEAD/DEAH box helicase [Polyangiales bacterium]|nr:DEAD/DEAH box helicase [Polyangiales bacterium]
MRTLGEQLLACAEPALLETALASLRVPDAEARELLQSIYESGDANTLSELLARETFERWLSEISTRSEQSTLAAQLRRWLGLGQAGPDDPARLATAPEVPHQLEALLAWARPHGVLDELIRPLAELLPHAPEWAREHSLCEACLDEFRPDAISGSPGPLQRERVVEQARGYLQMRAAAHLALAAREDLWRRKPPDSLSLVCERLRAVLAGSSLPALHGASFVPARPVRLDPASGVCRAQLRVEGEERAHAVRLALSGYEQRPPHAECSCGRAGCLHVRALAARLIDACCDSRDRLRPALLELASVPSWQRFLRALEPAPASADQGRERVSFRVRLAAERVVIGAFTHERRETGWTAGRLVSPHKLARAAACADRDRAVLELLSAQSRTLGAQYVAADLATLRALIEHPYVEIEASDGTRSTLRVAEQTLQLHLLEQPAGLLPRLTLAGAAPVLHAAGYATHCDRDANTLWIAALTPQLRRWHAALADFHGLLPRESHAQLAPLLAGLRQVAQVAAPDTLLGNERPPPRKLLLRITPRLEEGVDVLLCVRALALGPLWPPGSGPELVDGLEQGVAVYARRDLGWERETAAQLMAALELEQYMRLEAFGHRIPTTQQALALLSAAAHEHASLEIEWAETGRKLSLLAPVRCADLKVDLNRHGSWINLAGGAVTKEAQIAIGRLFDAVRRGERFVPVGGDGYAEIERELFERLERAQLCVMEPMREPAISPAALPFWLEQLGEQSSTDWLHRLTAQREPLPEIDPAWRARLREYQQHGLAWLLASSQWTEGVCLADEMGLGKTVQSIGLLAARAQLGPALIIAPTSVVFNWQNELARFAGELDVRVYRGAHRRKRLQSLGPGCVVLCSYELLVRDRDAFAELRFATQIVDEAQVIKNARTRRARAVAAISAEFRVALTGTPIENRLGDLWSVFALIAPGLLGSWPRFRARFAVPIERYENLERAEQLRALVAPLILRRTKREVAKELPSRTEVVHMIEPSAAERALYAAAQHEARRALGRRSRDEAAHQLQILAQLTRLRQLACHPRLVIDDPRVGSSKLASLLSLLEDILPRGHRVLVFSQFVRHLSLVREALERAAISFVYLDGATPAAQRAELVERFQREEVQAFLISLKAGGTGLNLTAADYVVHMDPWWNPAAEDQASDRAHRFGQTRPLTIVKLVARGTIEEKVLGLHDHKRRLAEAALGDASAANPRLDAATLEALL